MARRLLLPISTDRLTIRPLARDDVTIFTTYRNDPDIARFQDWELPWTRDHTHALLDQQEDVDDVVPGRWIQLAIDDEDGLVGDLAVWTDHELGLAMVGYTLAPAAHRRGYATEAVDALVAALFDRVGVHRVSATLDPLNHASARVLERAGFRYEGRSVSASRVRGEWADDDRYAVLEAEFRAWRDRPRTPPDAVSLVEITAEDARATTRIGPHRSQERFVATVAESFVDALFPEPMDGAPVTPWFRAVHADGDAAGFVMLADTGGARPPWLWRLVIDRRHQGRGIGRRVVELVVEHVRGQGATELFTSYVDESGGPARFYARLGFVPTGEIDDGEVVARLDLSA